MTQCVRINGSECAYVALNSREIDDILGDLCVFVSSWRLSTATVELLGALRVAQQDLNIAVTERKPNTT